MPLTIRRRLVDRVRQWRKMAYAICVGFVVLAGAVVFLSVSSPGTSVEVRPVRMHFGYDSEFGAYTPEAYERLLLEAMAGDPTLFIRRDEVEIAWQLADSIRSGWNGKALTNREFYAAGTWGPVAADEMLAGSGQHWREPVAIKPG